MTAKKTTPIQEVLARLQAPFDSGNVEHIRVGGRTMKYAHWTAYQQRLDDVVGPSNWKVEFAEVYDDGGQLRKVIYSVFVRYPGDDEWVRRDGHWMLDGQETMRWDKMHSKAFRRACTWHGVGRYLYRHSDLGEDEDIGTPAPSTPSQHRNGRTPAPARGGQAKRAEDIATAAMLKRIDQLSKEVFGPALWDKNKKKAIQRRTGGSRPLTKAEAQEMIANLERLDSQEEVDFQ